jgi:hypothetical protein
MSGLKLLPSFQVECAVTLMVSDVRPLYAWRSATISRLSV